MPSITRKAQSRRTERRASLSAELLRVIRSELAEGFSYTEISVERLCDGAGISRSTFYAYFEDKGHLLREITAELLTELGEIAAEWWDRGPAIEREELREIMLRLVRKYREHDLPLAAVIDTSVYDPAVREVFSGLIEGFIGEIAAMIEASAADNGGADSTPAHETAGLLTWMATYGYYQMAGRAEDATLERIADAHADIIWRTVHDRH